MLSSRLSENSTQRRNELQNLTSYIINKMFPGSQRNCTTRDSQAFTDSNDISRCVNYDVFNANLVVGQATALD